MGPSPCQGEARWGAVPDVEPGAANESAVPDPLLTSPWKGEGLPLCVGQMVAKNPKEPRAAGEGRAGREVRYGAAKYHWNGS